MEGLDRKGIERPIKVLSAACACHRRPHGCLLGHLIEWAEAVDCEGDDAPDLADERMGVRTEGICDAALLARSAPLQQASLCPCAQKAPATFAESAP